VIWIYSCINLWSSNLYFPSAKPITFFPGLIHYFHQKCLHTIQYLCSLFLAASDIHWNFPVFSFTSEISPFSNIFFYFIVLFDNLCMWNIVTFFHALLFCLSLYKSETLKMIFITFYMDGSALLSPSLHVVASEAHGLNIHEDTKPQMSAFLQNWPVKIPGGRCLSVWGHRYPNPPPPLNTLYEYIPLYLFTQGRGGGRWASEKVRGALVHKRGRKYQCGGSGMFIPDPGSWFLPIPDPGSRISDPGSKNSNERNWWKKICFHTFFLES
jgi:hypothetical protein